MISLNINSQGLINRLRELEADVERKIGDKAMSAGAREYAKLVRSQIPKGRRERRADEMTENRQGKEVVNKDTQDRHLKRSIAVRKAKGAKRRGIIQFRVGIVGWARAYAHVYEFGSKHVQGKRIFTKTFESNFKGIMDKIADVMRAEIAKHGRS